MELIIVSVPGITHDPEPIAPHPAGMITLGIVIVLVLVVKIGAIEVGLSTLMRSAGHTTYAAFADEQTFLDLYRNDAIHLRLPDRTLLHRSSEDGYLDDTLVQAIAACAPSSAKRTPTYAKTLDQATAARAPAIAEVFAKIGREEIEPTIRAMKVRYGIENVTATNPGPELQKYGT
jgi:hypothetical protein